MFILNPYNKVTLPLVLEIDTTKTGVTPSNGFQIPASAPGGTYSYKVDWGDGTITSGHTGITSHTYATGGIYQVKIYGEFPRMYFNNGGDRQKLLKVLDWGEINYSTNQTGAFYGCVNLEFIATDTLNAWYNNIVLGNNMLYNSNLTSLPDGMVLANLTNGTSMFRDNSLTSLPDGMTLANLTNGNYMFQDNSLTSLPDGMVLANLTTGGYMFRGNALTSLSDGMELSNLTNGFEMFRFNPITSAMGLKLHNINNGLTFMQGANLPSNQYSNILVEIEANNPNNGVSITFGASKYNSTGQTARNILTSAPRNWAINDGGLE